MPIPDHRRNLFFFLTIALSILPFFATLEALVELARTDDRYTHIIFIPVIAVGLIILERKKVFLEVRSGLKLGIPLAVLGLTTHFVATLWGESLSDSSALAFRATGIVLTWIGVYVIAYGSSCARASLFPLLFLLLAVPTPPGVVENTEVALQHGSADMTHILFKLAGTPVFRDDLVFALPGLTIEVAQECSGIRSSTALLITALLLAHLFLRSNARRLALIVLTVPIAIFKNALRIATLSWLGAFVSEDYLHGSLHHRGGPVFSILPLILVLGVLWVLRRGDSRGPAPNPRPSPDAPTLTAR